MPFSDLHIFSVILVKNRPFFADLKNNRQNYFQSVIQFWTDTHPKVDRKIYYPI